MFVLNRIFMFFFFGTERDGTLVMVISFSKKLEEMKDLDSPRKGAGV